VALIIHVYHLNFLHWERREGKYIQCGRINRKIEFESFTLENLKLENFERIWKINGNFQWKQLRIFQLEWTFQH